MASDLRVLKGPLEKRACTACGYIGVDARSTVLDFGDYELYAHAPGGHEERSRQTAFAAWIVRASAIVPTSVFDAGCGNGSLLVELRAHWPAAALRGRDPAASAVAFARAAGIDASVGLLDPADRAASTSELVISVNVIEHTSDPQSFLRALLAQLAEGARIVLIAPDGSRPNSELLIADHRHSFAPAHLRALCAEVGLEVMAQESAPPELGALACTVARRAGGRLAASTFSDPAPTIREAERFLASWGRVDATLLQRLGSRYSLSVFGAGEATGLLRAYAPAVWERVRRCAIDHPGDNLFGDRPVVPTRELPRDVPVIVAVRSEAVATVSNRLAANGLKTIRYDDIIHQASGVHP